ncbi:hypothetical protein X975_17917, partial [Stegodyphus mimosarum]
MTDVDCAEEVAAFEEMFQDRFTEKDEAYIAVKSKKIPPPSVIYPWKPMQKQWNKRWDYNTGRHQEERDRSRHNDHRHQRNDSRDRYRDRSPAGESSNYRDKRHASDDSYNRPYKNQDRDRKHDDWKN